tara:strand:+ start:1393 stop:1662 length:270 start_codon:yes stop_codon:yes gene_type:complete
MKHKKKVMGHHIFVPLDDSVEVTITPNFYTNTCAWCDKTFHSFKPAVYCSPSHKASAGRKRATQKYEDEIAELKAKISELNGHHALDSL